MNIAGLVAALLPVFFVLALGYIAGRRHAFDANQAAGLSKLALDFALPAALFVSMTEIKKGLLLQQGRLMLALLIAHLGLFLLALIILKRIRSLQSKGAVIWAMLLSTSATPVFGFAVLQPLLGDASAGTVGLVALAINLVIPLALLFLEIANAPPQTGQAPSSVHESPLAIGFKAGVKSPLLWAPILGIAVVFIGVQIPRGIASSFVMIGSATSGVAVFTVGLTLAAHSFHLSRTVVVGTIGRVTMQTALLFLLVHLFHISSPFAREALVCTSFPMATIVVLFASKYEAMEAETSSILLLSTISLFLTAPLTIALGR